LVLRKIYIFAPENTV